jgi:branched-chain amino acid transport system ATP-binding protein
VSLLIIEHGCGDLALSHRSWSCITGEDRHGAPRVARDRACEAYLGEVAWRATMSLLTLRGVDVAYGDLPALRGIDLAIEPGEILSVVGANGAGKTTMLRAISGLLRPRAGEILLDGARLDRMPCHAVVEQGVVQVPEGRKIFPTLTVLENLELGSYTRAARIHRRESLERVLGLFPILAERRRQPAGTMSGGQQQMLAIGRALIARPRLLMLDEPSLGLAPKIVQEIFAIVAEINRAGSRCRWSSRTRARPQPWPRRWARERLRGALGWSLSTRAPQRAYLGM